jgi:hypothetical protein
VNLSQKLRHAFAVDPPGPAEPTEDQQVPVDWVCRQVAKRRLSTAGLVALELSRPLNFVASQAMIVVSPVIWAFARQLTYEQYNHFAAFLERRGSIDYLTARIEHFEAELAAERAERAERAEEGAEQTARDQEDDGKD